ncbi:hypothetical protein MKEN_01426600 [Mycena kentingensis (nom. inval.)]|nr:hypothetical protein MKEN_01426600 [Mycena kentingensis (nom. inval.)]
MLPGELFAVIALHSLVTEPLPDGKSLHAMLAGTSQKPQPSALRASVEKAVHEAFWAQARSTLETDPYDGVKRLVRDVCEAITPLVPSNDPIIAALSLMAPTTAPLESGKLLLRDVLLTLRRRAAPIRDQHIDHLLANLDNANHPEHAPEDIVETVKAILELADTMKHDLGDFAVASMTETQLRLHLTQQARIRERTAILDLWDTGSRVDDLWQAWVDEQEGPPPPTLSPREAWIRRLVRALGKSVPVACPIPNNAAGHEPMTERNDLPPPFFFSKGQLLHAQNYLQAIVASASLGSLFRIGTESDFVSRIWALLEAEIVHQHGTKLINLADEVVRARGLVSAPDPVEEARLRAAVDRTLRYTDPVFKLLQKRLLDALARALMDEEPPATQVPERMQSGRALAMSKKPASGRSRPVVQGFEDPFLANMIGDIFHRIRETVVDWIDTMWLHPEE